MVETYKLLTYWGYRTEEPSETAERLEETWRGLRRVHSDLFADWKETVEVFPEQTKPDGSPEDAEPFPREQDELVERIREEGVGGGGYSFAMWNRLPDDTSTKLNVSCGGGPEGLQVMNNAILNVPLTEDDDWKATRLDRDQLIECVRVLASAWEAEWGGLSTYETRTALDELLDIQSSEPTVGWITYLDDDRPAVPELPEACEVDRDFADGTLIVMDETPMWSSNDEDVGRLRRTQERLREAGVMRPVFPDE
jgi:hypothetical protein